MKKIKSIIAVMIACVMVFAFTACGSSIDASALVKSNLDFYTTGEVTDEILSAVTMSEEELVSQYDEEFEEMLDDIVGSLDCDDYMNNGGREQIEAFVKAYMGACKYDVSDEATKNDDDSYTVEVTAYKMDFVDRMADYINGDWNTNWMEKIQNGEYTYTTQEQLMADMYGDLFPALTELLGEVGYDEEGTVVEVKVEQDSDGNYVPDMDDLEEVLSACMGI